MVVDRRTSTPLYLQLKDAILADIRQGLLRPGDRIGSETEMERLHRVSRITVRQAINGLVQDGELTGCRAKAPMSPHERWLPSPPLRAFPRTCAPLDSSLPTGSLWPARVILHSGSVRTAARGNGAAFRLQRVLLADGEPIGLQSGFYPQAMLASGDGLWTPENLSTCSLYNLFEKT